jgi:hypothetical protein
MTGMGIEQNMFCSLLTHHSLKHRSPRISVAAQRGPAPANLRRKFTWA